MIGKGELQELYQQGLSMREIADQNGWPYPKVVYWTRKYGIPRRSRSEANYLKYNPNGDPFKIKTQLTPKEKELKGLGLGLYGGEGTKADKYAVRLGNSDPRLINKFIEFLIRIFGIDKARLKFGLQIFSDMDPDTVLDFWVKELAVDKSQFQKPVITKSGKFGTYKNKTRYGVVTVYFHNIRLRNILDEMLLDV